MTRVYNVLIGAARETVPLAVRGTQPTLEASGFRKRQKVEAEMRDSEVAALSPLCLHAFAHAVPHAQNTLPYLLSSLFLASHYLSIKISLGPPLPKSPP